MPREWSFWTRNKLEILSGYLPAFNQASQKSGERLYIDLMAGEPVNIDKATGELFDGSARLALSASPGFTRLAFCELPRKAALLEADLQARYPGRCFRVYPGDCNEKITEILADLSQWRRAPTFVFADQQAAEIHWRTLERVAGFRTGRWKAEIWILMSPVMIAKGVAGTDGDTFAGRVDALFGGRWWRRIQAARDRQIISAEDYRDEMVNLLRIRLERKLGYNTTVRIPMRMTNGLPLYDMVFATDHPVGDKIMTSLFRKAAEREPGMRQEARARASQRRDQKRAEATGHTPLFEVEASFIPVAGMKWEPSGTWDPTARPWWTGASVGT
jgi:three-Cys-motif partner protein